MWYAYLCVYKIEANMKNKGKNRIAHKCNYFESNEWLLCDTEKPKWIYVENVEEYRRDIMFYFNHSTIAII